MTVTSNEWLGFAEIAARTGLPEANLRRWRKRFPAWCPSKVFGRVEKFRPDVIAVFQLVAKLYGERRTSEEVKAALQALAAPTIDVGEGAPDEKLTLPHAQAVNVGAILAVLGPVAEKYLAILERQTSALVRANRIHSRFLSLVERRLTLLERVALANSQKVATSSMESTVSGKSPEGHSQKQTRPGGPQAPRKRHEIIAEVRRLHAEGLGSRAIATAMHRAGWPTLSGRGQWAKGSVARILRGEGHGE